MRLNWNKGRIALLLTLATILVAGCMPRGGTSNPGWTVVAAQGDTVYTVLPTGRVVGLDGEQDGAELWSYPVGEAASGVGCAIVRTGNEGGEETLSAVYGVPAFAGDLVLITSYDGRLLALDRETGGKAWEYATEEPIIGGVAVVDGVAYFGSSDHRLYALDIDTQELVWGEPFETGNWIWGKPAIDDGSVYVGSLDHHVYAVNRETGQEQWRIDVGGSVPGSVTLADGVLFAGSVDRRLHALDSQTGSELWKTEPLGGWLWGEALVKDGYVYFGSLDGQIYGLSVADGSQRWDPVAVEGAVRAGPVCVDDSLIVGTEDGNLYSVACEDGERDTLAEELDGAVLSLPSVEGEMIYVGTTAGTVHAFDLSRRDPVAWVYPPKED